MSSPLPDEAAATLRRLRDDAPRTLEKILALEPPPLAPTATPTARHDRLVALVGAAAEAASHGEPELALRGYTAAFALSRSSALLLSAGGMLYRLGALDEAHAVFSHLLDEPSLSADQRTVLLSKLEQTAAARAARADAPAAPPPTPDRRASMRHQEVDRQMLRQLRADAPPVDVSDATPSVIRNETGSMVDVSDATPSVLRSATGSLDDVTPSVLRSETGSLADVSDVALGGLGSPVPPPTPVTPDPRLMTPTEPAGHPNIQHHASF